MNDDKNKSVDEHVFPQEELDVYWERVLKAKEENDQKGDHTLYKTLYKKEELDKLIASNFEHADNPLLFRRAFLDKDLKVIHITQQSESFDQPYDSIGAVMIIDSESAQLGEYYDPFYKTFSNDRPCIYIDYRYLTQKRFDDLAAQSESKKSSQEIERVKVLEKALRDIRGICNKVADIIPPEPVSAAQALILAMDRLKNKMDKLKK
jgi:hypothetical protein